MYTTKRKKKIIHKSQLWIIHSCKYPKFFPKKLKHKCQMSTWIIFLIPLGKEEQQKSKTDKFKEKNVMLTTFKTDLKTTSCIFLLYFMWAFRINFKVALKIFLVKSDWQKKKQEVWTSKF